MNCDWCSWWIWEDNGSFLAYWLSLCYVSIAFLSLHVLKVYVELSNMKSKIKLPQLQWGGRACIYF